MSLASLCQARSSGRVKPCAASQARSGPDQRTAARSTAPLASRCSPSSVSSRRWASAPHWSWRGLTFPWALVAHFQGCLALLLAGFLLFVILVIVAEGGGQGDMRCTHAQHIEKRREGAVDQILGGAALLAASPPPCHSLLPLAGNGKKRQLRVAVGEDEVAHPLLHQRVARPLWVGGQAHETDIFAAQKGNPFAAVLGHLGGGHGMVFHKRQQRGCALQVDAGPPFVQEQGGPAASLGEVWASFAQAGDEPLPLWRQEVI